MSVLAWWSAPLAGVACSAEQLPVSPEGAWLSKNLDRLDVQRHWLRSHDHVAWRTGVPLLDKHGNRLTPLDDDETHCSTFAAAAADALGIYLLHPPEHSHVLLSNAQVAWLPSEAGRKAGWQPVESPLEAQRRANRGEFVVAAYKNPRPTAAGHVAIVRPAALDAERIKAEGPQITQAGFNNFRSASLADGFDQHPGAWQPGGRGGVKFFAHTIDHKKAAGE